MTNSDQSFLKHAAVYGAGTLLLQAASVILLPLYTRYLTPADYGVLEILNRTGDVLAVVLMANGLTGAAFTFFCQAETAEEKARIAATLNVLMWFGCAIGLLLVFATASLLGSLLGVEDRSLVVLGIGASIAQLLSMIPLILMQARVESLAFVVASAVMFFLRVVLTVVAVTFCGLGMWGVIGGSLVASLISAALLIFREVRQCGFRPDFSKLPAMLRFAWPFVPGGLCGFILASGDRFFLLHTAGPEEVGLYSLGYKLASCVELVAFTPLFKVWSARMYDVYRRPNASTLVGQMFTRLLAPYIFVGLGVCLFRHEIVLALGTAAYAGAAAAVVPLVLAYFFISAQVLLDGAFYVYRCSHYKLGITVFATATIVLLYSQLIPAFGAMGAALSAAGAFFVYAVATFIVSQRVFWVKYEKARLLTMLLIAGLLAAPDWWLDGGLASNFIRLACLAAWPIAIWVLGLVAPEEKEIIFGYLVHARRLFGDVLHSAGDNSGHNGGVPQIYTGKTASFASPLKFIARTAAVQSRLLRATSSILPRSAIILRYHSVQAELDICDDPVFAGISHLATVFEQQMKLLAERFTPVTLDQIRSFLDGVGTIPRRSVAVTFDDGYRDNFEIAAPILRRYGVPATFYVTVSPVKDETSLWFSRLRYAFHSTTSGAWTHPLTERTWPLTTPAERYQAFLGAGAYCATLTGERQSRVVADIEKNLSAEQFPHGRTLVMTWDQIRELDSQGHIVGSHTMCHPNLAHISQELAMNEMRESKRILEAQLGHSVHHFSYPNPILNPHWTAFTAQAVDSLGFLTAVTCDNGAVRRSSSPFCLRRVAAQVGLSRFQWSLETNLLHLGEKPR